MGGGPMARLAVGAACLAWLSTAAAGAAVGQEEPSRFAAAVGAVVDELGVPAGDVVVDPRPVDRSLHAFSAGLPALFLDVGPEVTVRRRLVLDSLGIEPGDAVLGSSCWAAPVALSVDGRGPDTTSLRAIREWEERCREHRAGATYLVVSLPRRDVDVDFYTVVAYGLGCVSRWEARLDRDGPAVELDGGADLCT